MANVLVDGIPYTIIESLGFNHDIGMRAWVVQFGPGERVAVGARKNARFWTAKDRVKPLIEAVKRSKPGDPLFEFKAPDQSP